MSATRVRQNRPPVSLLRPVGGRSRGKAALRILFGTSPARFPRDVAMALVRVALAWIFFYYGSAKLFGAFNGPGIHRTALYYSNVAHLHPGGFFAVLGGVIELGGGIAVAIGLGTRLAGLALFGDMVMAMITVTWATGIASVKQPPGYQVNLALCVLALALAILGPGRLSLDALLARGARVSDDRPSVSRAGTGS